MLNQEFIIPRIADKLALDRDDPGGQKSVAGARRLTSRTASTSTGDRADAQRPHGDASFRVHHPGDAGRQLLHLTAKEAHYVPGAGPRQGGWELIDTTPTEA